MTASGATRIEPGDAGSDYRIAPLDGVPGSDLSAGRRRFLGELARPSEVFVFFTPNWFAAVMGTGVVAVAVAGLPVQSAALHSLGVTMWVVAGLLLSILFAATALHWCLHPVVARGHARHPIMMHFYGAPPMAMLTVGASTLLIGRDVIGLTAAFRVDWLLWSAGTLLGLTCAVWVPVRMRAIHGYNPASACGAWLMPVVPPMVSASTGALLVPHVRSGSGRLALLLGCYCLFMFATIASAVVIAMIGRRLLAGGLSFGEIRPASMMDIGPAPMVPTWWIVLGPLGQSITALGLLGGVAHDAVPVPVATALHWCGILYGVPVWCGAIAWIPVAAAFTLRTARTGLPFSLTWWSFVFPVATTVTGSSGLASHTGLSVFRFAAILLFIALLAAGIVVGSKTVQGSYRGRLFKPPVGS